MSLSNREKIKHLAFRADFGPLPGREEEPVSDRIDRLFADSEKFRPLKIPGETDFKTPGDLRDAGPEARKIMRKESRKQIRDLNFAWHKRLGKTGGLREKMTLFWHNHFASQNRKAGFVLRQNNLLRRHALGRFSDLLKAVSKDAVMIQYLNNQQNTKKKPNENFAREVMELFTLGRGNYTEEDVKNAARAFTGWSFDRAGDFRFRERRHDTGSKTFLGKTGDFDGDEILEILLAQKQTAIYLTGKIFRHFVNASPTAEDEQFIAAAAADFYASDYDISRLMRRIFSAELFYAARHIGSRIKSPTELLAGLQRQVGLEFEKPETLFFLQKVLGQMLFFPPNVAGWPGGRQWIDSTTLLVRMSLPKMIFYAQLAEIEAEDRGDEGDSFRADRRMKKAGTTFGRKKLNVLMAGSTDANRLAGLAEKLLAGPLSAEQSALIEKRLSGLSGTDREVASVAGILALPDYQMC